MKKFKYGLFDSHDCEFTLSNTEKLSNLYRDVLEDVELHIDTSNNANILKVTAKKVGYVYNGFGLPYEGDMKDVCDFCLKKNIFGKKVLKSGWLELKKRKPFKLTTNIIKILEK